MANHTDSRSCSKSRGLTTGTKKIITAPMTGVDMAIVAKRPPECKELFEECKCLMGAALIGLRNAKDAVRLAQAIAQLVKSISIISNAEKLDQVSISVLEKMDDTELKNYANKLLEKI